MYGGLEISSNYAQQGAENYNYFSNISEQIIRYETYYTSLWVIHNLNYGKAQDFLTWNMRSKRIKSLLCG